MNHNKHAATARERHPEYVEEHAEAPLDVEERQRHLPQVANGDQRTAPGVARSREESEDRYRRLLQGVPAIACELASEGTTLFVNDAVARLTGYQPEELIGRNWWDVFFPGELRAQVEQLYHRLPAGDVRDCEMTIATKGGARRALLWQFSSQYLPDGALESFVGYGVDITEHKRADEELQRSVDKLKGLVESTIEAMAMTVEIRDPYTAGHQRRVAALGCSIGEELSLPEQRISVIRLAGIVHDIGKISVPAEILSKPGNINQVERELIRGHAQTGYTILSMIQFPWPIAQIVHQHHERLNGSGYPLGLSGEDILLEARILGVADVVESMAGFRPYRPALGVDQAMKEITKNRGILYDPRVVDACLRIIPNIEFLWD